MEIFEINARRFLDKDMSLTNKKLENAKRKFLISLIQFIHYTDLKFNPISNPNIVKFLGRTSEHDYLINGEYEKEEKTYLRTARKMYNDWIKFHQKLKKIYPNYVWPK